MPYPIHIHNIVMTLAEEHHPVLAWAGWMGAKLEQGYQTFRACVTTTVAYLSARIATAGAIASTAPLVEPVLAPLASLAVKNLSYMVFKQFFWSPVASFLALEVGWLAVRYWAAVWFSAILIVICTYDVVVWTAAQLSA